MAKYTITHSCGHEVTHDLIGPGTERERKLEWLKVRECRECYVEKQNAKASEASTDLGLVELHGSDKQVAWATSIRAKAASRLIEWVKNGHADAVQIATAAINDYPQARFWIDNRFELETLTGIVGLLKADFERHASEMRQ